MPQDVLDKAFEQAKIFFAQPMEKKMEVDLKLGDSFKGYVRKCKEHRCCSVLQASRPEPERFRTAR